MKYIIYFLISLVMCSPLIQECIAGGNDNLKQLESVQVKQYEGANLSSIGDFRENSIKGPSFIER